MSGRPARGKKLLSSNRGLILTLGNINGTIDVEIFVYVEPNGRRPFDRWFDRLDPAAATKVRTAIARIELGNLSNAKGVGGGVLEYRIDYGPGYRVYFGRDGDAFVILLGGGIKQRQDEDIAVAQARWLDYRQRKRELR